VGAYLLRLGFSLSTALLANAALLTCRFGMRLVALAVVRRLGFRNTIMLGAGLAAAQFLPLMNAGEPRWFVAWLLIVSLAESLYWPVYHAAAAITGGDGSRGRELGIRTAVGALVGVLGPLAGGFLLERFGPAVDFGITAALTLASVLPLAALRAIPAGPVPSLRESVRAIDRAGILTFAADGWMASGLAMAWPMVLFGSLGSHYESFGIANAAAGVAGAVAGLICGHAIDRGERDRCLALVCCALALGFALRACASWSPLAATIANATGAAIAGFYTPVVMSTVYDQAKRSGAAYRFHFAAEAGWDAGAVGGCLAAAAVASVAMAPSLSLLPAVLGVAAVYWCVRGQATLAPPRSLPVADAATAG